MNKVFSSFDEAVADIGDGSVVMVGGAQGPLGVPRNLIMALNRKGARDLTVINSSGYRGPASARAFAFPHSEDWVDHSVLIDAGQVRKVICGLAFFTGRGTALQKLHEEGKMELEHVGHGNLAARIWAGGAGLGGIYSPVGVGTVVADGQETRMIDGREYLFLTPLKADFALIWAHRADTMGNLIYRGTGRQYGPLMARAAGVTIVEADKIVEPGGLDPESVVTPGVYVHRLVEIPEDLR